MASFDDYGPHKNMDRTKYDNVKALKYTNI